MKYLCGTEKAGLLGMVYHHYLQGNSRLSNSNNLRLIGRFGTDYSETLHQAIANVAPDLPPQPNQYPQIARDYEYKRHGTASILAGLDLHDGHVFAQVQHRHRSREFIELLKEIDAYYPLDAQIR